MFVSWNTIVNLDLPAPSSRFSFFWHRVKNLCVVRFLYILSEHDVFHPNIWIPVFMKVAQTVQLRTMPGRQRCLSGLWHSKLLINWKCSKPFYGGGQLQISRHCELAKSSKVGYIQLFKKANVSNYCDWKFTGNNKDPGSLRLLSF